jgi:DeoR/GlpR family transcriptional regulator of sugar metabolism
MLKVSIFSTYQSSDSTFTSTIRIRPAISFMTCTLSCLSYWETRSAPHMEEAYVKRALVEHAAETVVLASVEKLHAASAYKIADVSAASTIVVERSTPEGLAAPFEALGITILRA